MTKAVLLALIIAAPAAALDVPPLTRRVEDRAQLLSQTATEDLEAKLRGFEHQTGHQLAVLTIPSLQGEVLEAYSLKVARTWKLGRKGVNDGVLLFVARDERRVRVEVGHGLEGAIPDALAGRIISDEIAPRFRDGSYAAGIDAGTDALIAAATGGYRPRPERRAAGARSSGKGPAYWLFGIPFFVFFLAFLLLFEVIGIAAPVFGWVFLVFLVPFWYTFPTIIFGPYTGMFFVMTHLLLFPVFKILFGGKGEVHWPRRGSSGSSDWGSSDSGSSFSSSDSGGSDFGGGGGSFGGGGASGSW